jgi:ankyrin repeat protein
VNVSGGFFGNPLQAGAFHGHEAVVRTLLESGADPLASDTALHAALAGGHQSVIELLLGNEAFPNPSQIDDVLSRASYDGHDRVVCQLLTRAALKQ